jgi:hypothetical protein
MERLKHRATEFLHVAYIERIGKIEYSPFICLHFVVFVQFISD